MKISIRQETSLDFEDVFRINAAAFGRENESRLVDNLRQHPRFIPEFSLVAEYEKKSAGHIFFLPVKVKGRDKDFETLSLAPMAVWPEHQNKGIGSQLVRAGLDASRLAGFHSVVVVGHPAFYPRFGFEPASKWNIRTQYEIPDDVFMAVELIKGGLKEVEGRLEFPEEYLDCM